MALVQTCEVDEKQGAFFLTSVDNYTITKSLYNANGRCGDVGVSVTKNLVTKCHFSTEAEFSPVTFTVPKKTRVVDIDVMCFQDRFYGIVVASNSLSREEEMVQPEKDEDDGFTTKKQKAARLAARDANSYNTVDLYIEDRCNNFRIYRRLKVIGEITCMRVLISQMDMAAQQPFLSERIGAWPNLIAIGCKNTSCYIGALPPFDPDNLEHWAAEEVIMTTAGTDALKSLVHDGRFCYSSAGAAPYYFRTDEAYVSAVAYIPCYGVLVVGLSSGGIVMVPLDGHSSSYISCLTVPYAVPINHLVILEPEFDPQGGFYIFSARARPQTTIKNASLVIFSHKIARQSNGGDKGGYDYNDRSTVMIPFKDGSYWVNVHGIVKKRKKREADASLNNTADNSQLPVGLNTTQYMHGDGLERTLLFYSYVSLAGEMKGGLFDLNAFYSRRCCPQQVQFDEFKQDPICTQFTLKIPLTNTGQPRFRVKDISFVHCDAIGRYTTPIFDRDPLFQPMAVDLSIVIHTYGKYVWPAYVHSLQHTVLDRIARSLPTSLSQSDVAVALLERVGLVLAPTTRKERLRMEERPANERVPADLDKIMRAVASDENFRRLVVRFIASCTDRVQLLHIGRWMFNEMREIVERMDESIAPLFDGVSPELMSKEAKELFAYCPAFFEFCELVFWKVRARGQEQANDTTRLRYTRKLHALMAFDLRLFLAAIKYLIWKLPMCKDWTNDLLEEVAEMNEERRKKAKRQGHPLFLDALLTRLHEKTMDDGLWMGIDVPVEWYPPPRFHLVSLLRQNEAPLADRTSLFLYYLMDVDEILRRNGERPRGERKGYPVKQDDYSLSRLFLDMEGSELVNGSCYHGVEERWESDMKGAPEKENGDAQPDAPVSALSAEEKAEMENFYRTYKVFRKLQRVDEARMRELMNKQSFGIYRWNLLLIKKGRFPEVEDLPVPDRREDMPHIIVAEYAKYKKLALNQKAQLPPPTYSNAYACPYVVTKATAKPVAQTTVEQPRIVRTGNMIIRGKTPVKIGLFKRLTTTTATVAVAAAAGPSAAGPSTPIRQPVDAETARINALMKTPSMRFHNKQDDEDELEDRENNSNVAPDEVARVREALRTPRSRVSASARGAAAALDVTPEMPRPPMMVPTSILKSAHKESRLPQSVTKSRLRFAKVFDEKSISPRELDSSSIASASMAQPNFDDSFDDERNHVLSKSGSTDPHNLSSRLEREIEEEEEREKRPEEPEETEEKSMDSIDLQPLSSGEGEEAEEMFNGRVAAAAGTPAESFFEIYQSSSADEADVAFVGGSSQDSAASTQPKTPPPTPEEEEEAALGGAAGDGEEEEQNSNLSRAETPEEEEQEEPAAVVEKKEEVAAAGDDHLFVVPVVRAAAAAAASSAAMNTTYTIVDTTYTVADSTCSVADATFTVEMKSDGGPGEGEKETADAAAAARFAAEEKEHEQPAAEDAAAKGPADEEEEEPNLSRATTPVDGEEKEQDEQEKALAAAADEDVVGDEGDKREEEEDNVSRGETPVEEEEGEKEAAVAEEEDMEDEEEEEEVVAAPVAAAAAPAASAPLPPVPKPRTVFANRAEAVALGLHAYTFLEDGIEKSYEEQRDTDDEEKEGEQSSDILARLQPGRSSSSRLQQGAAAAASGGGGCRKRTASRRDSEKEAAGPSTSMSPRGKKERREEEDEKEEEEGDGHLFTTTRTRVVEERYVERDDGVLQHTIKQSTNVIETADGVVVKKEQEDKETIEEEGDKEETDSSGRVTPAMAEAAAEPSTARRSSRVSAAAAASRSRAQPSASRLSSSSSSKKERKRDEKASTPLRSPCKSMPRARKLMEEEKEEEEEKIPPTPRRSTRSGKSDSSVTASTVSETPSKSSRRSTRSAAKSPSREPSVVSASTRRLELASPKEAEKKDEEETAAAAPATTPRRRGRPRKSVSDEAASTATATVAVPPVPAKRKSVVDAASTSSSIATRRRTVSENVLAKRMEEKKKEEEQKKKEEEEQKKKEEEEEKKKEEEEEECPIAALRRRRDEAKASLEARRKYDAERKGGRKTLAVIKEDSEDKVSGKGRSSQKKDEDQPSTSQASAARSPPRRKRAQSEATTREKEEPVMQTPAKKKTKSDEQEDGSQSVLRRSSRKAAATANECPKTPSKSSRSGQ